MRYQNPIVAVKQVKATGDAHVYTKNIVSFQSMGATNISGVNNLPLVQLCVSKKNRGKDEDRRVWGIEQNEGWQTYLGFPDGSWHIARNARRVRSIMETIHKEEGS